MSERLSEKEDSMLTHLSAVEQRKAGGALPSLSADRLALIKQRVLNDKADILAKFENEEPALRILQPRRRRAYFLGGIAALLLLAAGSILLTRRLAETQSRVAYQVGNARSGNLPLEKKSAIEQAEVITTGIESIVVLRHGMHVSTVLGEDSELVIRSSSQHEQIPEFILEQRKGVAFFRVDKGKSRLTIRSPHGEVKVIGTAFLVATQPSGTKVQVLEGTVSIIPSPAMNPNGRNGTRASSTENHTLLQAGQKVHLDAAGRSSKISMLSSADRANLVAHMRLAALVVEGGHEEAQAMLPQLFSGERAVVNAGRPETSARMSLADIKRRFGKISRVILTNGKAYIGFFTLKGDQIQIITPKGTIRVASDRLKEVRDAE